MYDSGICFDQRANIDMEGYTTMTFGPYVRELRTRGRVTLREFCTRYGHDPSNWSKVERGELPPVQDRKTLEQWASQLGLIKGSDEWHKFFDLAFLERGKIPDDLLSNEELVAALPLFFRTIRGNKNTSDQLERIVEMLRTR